MSDIVDVFIGIIVMLLVMFFGTSVIQAQTTVSEARSCKNNIVAALEDSDFNQNVVNDCISDATTVGYTVTIKLYKEDATGNIIVAPAGNTEDIVAADVKIGYQYKLTFLGNSRTHYVSGFAR